MASIHHTILLGRCGRADVDPAHIEKLRKGFLEELSKLGLREQDTCFDTKIDPSANELRVFARVIVPPRVLIHTGKYRQLHACLNHHDLTRHPRPQGSF